MMRSLSLDGIVGAVLKEGADRARERASAATRALEARAADVLTHGMHRATQGVVNGGLGGAAARVVRTALEQHGVGHHAIRCRAPRRHDGSHPDSYQALLDLALGSRNAMTPEELAWNARLDEHGQSPKTLMICCIDSRIDVPKITGTKPGEILVVRNPGGVISNNGARAAIELAVQKFGVANIVVMGHSGCGAMNCLIDHDMISHLRDASALEQWLERHQEVLENKRVQQAREELLSRDSQRKTLLRRLLNVVSEETVLLQLAHLRGIPCVQSAMAAENLQVNGWHYSIGDSMVHCYTPSMGRFVPLNEMMASPSEAAATPPPESGSRLRVIQGGRAARRHSR